jgi:hypothetical protein
MLGIGQLNAVQFISLIGLNATEDIQVMPGHDGDRPMSIKSDAH